MQIEIVEYYPAKKNTNKTSGTLHVYIIEWDMDIRGINIFEGKDKNIMIEMPFRKGRDEDTGKEIKYPIVSFTDKAKHRGLVSEIKKAATAYIKELQEKNKGKLKRLRRL